MARAPRPLRGWLNELVLVPALAILLFLPALALVFLLGFASPRLGPREPFGQAILLVALFAAYLAAVRVAKGRHERLHGRFP